MQFLSNKVAFLLLLFLFALVPWHAFWVTFISSFIWSNSDFLPKLSLFIASWKEVLVLVLWLLFLFKWTLENYKLKNINYKLDWFSRFLNSFPIKKLYKFDYFFFAFLAIALISWLFQSDSFIQWFWWFRLDFIYFVIFYLIRWFPFDLKHLKKIIWVFLLSSSLSLLFWLSLYTESFNRIPKKININAENYLNLTIEKKEFIEKFYNKKWEELFFQKSSEDESLEDFFKHHEQINFRNENFLNLMQKFWYSSNISSYNPDKPLAAFHFVEARWTARFSALFSWPNQLWFFSLVVIWLILSIFSFSFKKKITLSKYEICFLALSFFLVLISLYFSYSRSAWLWFIWIFWLFILFSFEKKFRLKIFVSGFLLWIISLFSIYFFASDFWNRVLVREWSTSVHFDKMAEWISQVLENPLWLWLWMAWPVTIRFSDWNEQNISENWFIQMFQEFWVHWWVVYLILLLFLILFLIKNIDKNIFVYWWFLWLSWILIAWIFLHSFEDIWTSLVLFSILWFWVWQISGKSENWFVKNL